MVESNAYERVTWRGRTFSRRTVAMLEAVEEKVGPLTIFQGSYNSGGVSASAGTHDGGGAVDAWCSQGGEALERAMRAVGFAAWFRPAITDLWGNHVHGIAIGDRDLSIGARAQVIDYYGNRDGLKGHAHDPSWKPTPIPVFDYEQENDVDLKDQLPNGKTVKDALLAALRLEADFAEWRRNEWKRDKALRQELRQRLAALPGKTRAQVEDALGDLLTDNEEGPKR